MGRLYHIRRYWGSINPLYTINNKCKCDWWVFSTSIPNKSFDQLLDISPGNHIYTETFVSEFSTLKYGLLIKTPNPWRKKTVYLTLVINNCSLWWDIQLNSEIEYMSKAMDFYPLQKTLENLWQKHDK